MKRKPINKSTGTTNTERILAALAERSFLNLWSYPTPFRDQRAHAKGDGKELCDLLVVCDPYVLIFGVKAIDWPQRSNSVAWPRWARRSIRDSIKQTIGAERWIAQHPTRIFLDSRCQQRLPLPMPDPSRRRVIQIILAVGASRACKAHTLHGTGTFLIDPSIKAGQHWPRRTRNMRPFAIGDVNPNGSFIHVFDDISFEVLMNELDTIRDFADYLEKRSQFLRSGRLFRAMGEENLFAHFAVHMTDEGHDFAYPPDSEEPLFVDQTRYERLLSNPRYIAKKQADEISYVWDRLIETFTTHMIRGTSLIPEGGQFNLSKSEIGVRHMAMERRVTRRMLGHAIATAMERGMEVDCLRREILRDREAPESDTGYFIQTLKFNIPGFRGRNYADYRRARAQLAEMYALGLLERNARLNRVIGVSCEPPGGPGNSSEDLLYAEQQDWTAEERKRIMADCAQFQMLQPGRSEARFQVDECPHVQ